MECPLREALSSTSICCIGILFIDNNAIISMPTSETTIPIEKIIEMTYSVARTQTAASYISTPLSTPLPTTTLAPIITLPSQLPNTLLPVYETTTPFTLPSSTAPNSGGAVCSCSGNTLNCGDFSTHLQAQACYDYCVSLGRGDVHGLDNDNDGLACENLP